MIRQRGQQIIVKSQFNIKGSRGRSVRPFITEYISRESACDPSLAYPQREGLQVGDGVGFTLDASTISREELLRLADVAEAYFQTQKRAIQEMVISFAPDYLKAQGLVPQDLVVQKKGDYQGQYDDVRIRHAVRSGMQSLADRENYRDPQMIAAIQHDTLHLHVHAVLYENHPKLSRLRGYEEKGVIKPSSFNQLTDEIDQDLTRTRGSVLVTTHRLLPEQTTKKDSPSPTLPQGSDHLWQQYLLALQQAQMLRQLQNQILIEENAEEEEEESLEKEESLEGVPNGPSLSDPFQPLMR